jgi:hypothetical protein
MRPDPDLRAEKCGQQGKEKGGGSFSRSGRYILSLKSFQNPFVLLE